MKRFTQKQAMALYGQLKELEEWLEKSANRVGGDCEEADMLRDIRETFEENGIERKNLSC